MTPFSDLFAGDTLYDKVYNVVYVLENTFGEVYFFVKEDGSTGVDVDCMVDSGRYACVIKMTKAPSCFAVSQYYDTLVHVERFFTSQRAAQYVTGVLSDFAEPVGLT